MSYYVDGKPLRKNVPRQPQVTPTKCPTCKRELFDDTMVRADKTCPYCYEEEKKTVEFLAGEKK